MLDHIGITVSDVGRAKAFYDAALAPLGIGIVMQVSAEVTGGQAYIGYGSQGRPYFWVGGGGPDTGRLHVAFSAPDRAGVDAFYKAAMAAGGRDNGPPGLRPHYHPNYYGAFVLDPDGLNVEAVCHAPA
ncbi:catechol 2,3-dioxygenase-like lactoylglutathione lyase family enzyme [Caulobacter ginsengisoli]|uniref:Catechol 2,3-dioxygenase-like lactoylglutathione lyase family enzyme n=1 Tax=Caulobacter ginsengisoli TaxID=400775 RepID=A0ABU0ITX2_9CAUL|nr:VOC family protein [Caulobacter ginsengisoli]MDQ0464806.1 catechol 2,3-dioxygenase-like lactoylglutathione lyase family enzyme [Caulobacter ginsengisoli]